jgi:putative PEP-CTERM system TPR-repeat lipoprotein
MNKRSGFAIAALSALAVLAACGQGDQRELLASARGYLENKDPKTAAIQLKNLLQSEPDSAEARLLLGKALLESGDAAGAAIELARAQDLGRPASEVAPLLAAALLAQNEYDRLTGRFATVELDDAQAMVDLQLALAAAYAAQGAPDKAREAIGKALARTPQSVPALIALARLKAAAGEYDSALAALDELLAGNADDADAWQLKGDVLAQGKADLPGAIAAYEKALGIRPAQVELHAGLISLHFAHKDLNAASRQFDAMKAAAPDSPLTRFYEAQLVFARGDYQLARQKLQDLLRVVPDNASVLNLAGATELQLGALAQAEFHLARAVQAQPGFAAARLLLAKVYLRGNQPAKALAVLGPMLDGNRVDPETLVTAGQAALLGGDAKAADGYFGRAASAGPNDVRARTAAAMSQLSKGRADAAFSELQSVAAADSGITADMALISARMSRRETDAALRAIDALEKKQPGSAAAADLRGQVYLTRKDAASARRSFEAALARDPRYLPAVTHVAALDFVEGKPAAAKARFDRLLELDPGNAQALLALAELKRREGAGREAVAAQIRAAIEARPADPQPRLALIDLELAHGDAKAALGTAQTAVAVLPNDVALQERLARALLATGDVNQASSTFGKIAVQHSDLALGHLGLAETHLMKKDFAAANRSARRALELAPHSLAAQRVAIMAAMGAKRPQDALAIARDMQSQRPKDSLGYILEGEIESSEERWARAAGAYRKALSTPNPAQAPGRLHAVLLKDKKPAEASGFAADWLRGHPEDWLFLLYLADASSSQGDLNASERYYRQLLQAQPNSAIALNNLASVLIRQNKPGAVALAERAVKAAPGRPALQDTLSLALASEGQFAKAIEMQKQVVATAPEVPVYRLTLAKIYLRSGDKARARSELENLLQPGKDFAQRAEATALLAQASS